MKKCMVLFAMLFALSSMAQTVLESGDYGVSVKDRRGRTHHCTFIIESLSNGTDGYLDMSMLDCPPKLRNIALFPYEGGSIYVSDRIDVTTDRGGVKFYEIRPLSSTQFEMTSHREYGDGGIGRPRKVVATKK